MPKPKPKPRSSMNANLDVVLRNIYQLQTAVTTVAEMLESVTSTQEAIMRELIVIKSTRSGAAANLFDTPAREPVAINTPIDEIPFEMPRHRGKRPVDLLGTRDADYLIWVYENVSKRHISDELYRRAGGRKAFRLFPGDPGYTQDLPQPVGAFSREYGQRFPPVDDFADDDIPF